MCYNKRYLLMKKCKQIINKINLKTNIYIYRFFFLLIIFFFFLDLGIEYDTIKKIEYQS